jgi:hypothetical protein
VNPEDAFRSQRSIDFNEFRPKQRKYTVLSRQFDQKVMSLYLLEQVINELRIAEWTSHCEQEWGSLWSCSSVDHFYTDAKPRAREDSVANLISAAAANEASGRSPLIQVARRATWLKARKANWPRAFAATVFLNSVRTVSAGVRFLGFQVELALYVKDATRLATEDSAWGAVSDVGTVSNLRETPPRVRNANDLRYG